MSVTEAVNMSGHTTCLGFGWPFGREASMGRSTSVVHIAVGSIDPRKYQQIPLYIREMSAFEDLE